MPAVRREMVPDIFLLHVSGKNNSLPEFRESLEYE